MTQTAFVRSLIGRFSFCFLLIVICYSVSYGQWLEGEVIAKSTGQITNGVPLARDAQGNIYVGDTEAFNFKRYGPSGGAPTLTIPIAQIIYNGQTLVGAVSGIAVDTDGTIFLTRRSQSIVSVHSSNGTFLRHVAVGGSAAGLVGEPQGIALSKDGRVIVAESGMSRVQLFNKSPEASTVATYGTFGSGTANFNQPRGVAVDADGFVYVADKGNFRIVKLKIENNAFVFVKAFGSQGTGNGQFGTNLEMPLAIGWDGHLFVGDQINNRVQEFTTEGEFVNSWFAHYPQGLVFTADNQLLVMQGPALSNVVKYSKFSIDSFTPASGPPGTVVTVTGTGFSNVVSENTFKINELAAPAEGTTSTKFQVKFKVPVDATTGKITITRGLNTRAISPKEFVVDLKVNDFSPKSATAGKVITITGSGFSANATKNIVKIGTTSVGVITSTPTELKVSVPAGPLRGKFSVQVETVVATSTDEMYVTGQTVSGETFPEYFTTDQPSAPFSLTFGTVADVQGVNIYHRGITSSDGTFQKQTISLPPLTSNRLTFSIPAAVFSDPLGTEVYWSVDNVDGATIDGTPLIIYKRVPSATPQGLIPDLKFGTKASDYQIISIPYKFDIPQVGVLFKDLGAFEKNKWRMYGMRGGSVVELTSPTDALLPAQAVWLIAKTPREIRHPDATSLKVSASNPYRITLSPGWNLVGNPYNFPISWNDVLAATNNTNVGTLRHYENGGYITGDVLKPYRGAFVFISGNAGVTVTFPITRKNLSGSRTADSRQEPINAANWAVDLRATDGSISNSLIAFGMNETAVEGRDRMDESAIPAPEGINSFEFSLRDGTPLAMVRDFVSPASNYTWNGYVTSTNGITLSWDNSYFGNNDLQLVLEIDGVAGLIDMRAGTSVNIPRGSNRYRIHYGSLEYVRKSTLSREALVGDPSPNPVSEAHQIELPVSIPPGGAIVTSRIVDLTGKTYVIISQKFEEGRHRLTLDRNDIPEVGGLFMIRVEVQGNNSSTSFTRKVVVR